MEKKGLSAVVGTILIILLVIVAVGIIWAVVGGLFRGSADEISTGQFLIDLEIKSASLSGTEVSVGVKRNVGAGTLSGIKFVFSDGESTKTAEESTSMDELNQESFKFDIAALGIPDAYEVSIAPIFKSASGADVLGNIVDRAEFREATDAGEEPPGDGVCGDGVKEGDEECDDGCLEGIPNVCEETVDDGDGCSWQCTWEGGAPPETCGDDIINDPLEQCDGGAGCEENCLCGEYYIPFVPAQVDCDEQPMLENLWVSSIWPGDAPKYFDSDELPTDGNEGDYLRRYVKFVTGLEDGCLSIEKIEHVVEGEYDKTHIKLEIVGAMVGGGQAGGGDEFKIWSSNMCGA